MTASFQQWTKFVKEVNNVKFFVLLFLIWVILQLCVVRSALVWEQNNNLPIQLFDCENHFETQKTRRN